MLAGRLRSSGVKVSRKRMRECVANVEVEVVLAVMARILGKHLRDLFKRLQRSWSLVFML